MSVSHEDLVEYVEQCHKEFLDESEEVRQAFSIVLQYFEAVKIQLDYFNQTILQHRLEETKANSWQFRQMQAHLKALEPELEQLQGKVEYALVKLNAKEKTTYKGLQVGQS